MSFPKGDAAPPDSGADNQAMLRADMELLNTDDEVIEDGEETPESDDEPLPPEPEQDKLEDEEEEDKVEEAPKEEVIPSSHPRPTVTEIKGKYPNFFKDFPDMRHMLFREQEYTSLFPTVEDAKEAQGRAEDFDHFSSLVNSGKSEDFVQFLGGIKEVDPKNLVNFAANFLPGLYKADRDTYFAVTTPVAESLLRNAYKAARESGDENLQNAALHIARWALGDPGYATGEKVTPPLKAAENEPKKDDKYEQEKEQFYTHRYNESRQFVSNTAQTRLTAEIKRGLDPGGVFNDFSNQLLVKEILNEIGAALEADKTHMDAINSMWKHAHKAGFAGNWKDRILATYMSRARAIMPAIRARIRQQALADQKGRVSQQEEKANLSSDRREISGSQNSGQRGVVKTAAPQDIDWRNTSDMDILNDNVKLKKR